MIKSNVGRSCGTLVRDIKVRETYYSENLKENATCKDNIKMVLNK